MLTAKVTFVGKTGLLMHRCDQEWIDTIKKWQLDPENKKKSKAGDDRYPAYLWMGYCYHDGKFLGIPSDNIMTCLREGATKISTGKGNATYKKASQAGIIVLEPLSPITTYDGYQIEWDKLQHLLLNDTDFPAQEACVQQNHFQFMKKNVNVNKKKHYRIRPYFSPGWKIETQIAIDDSIISKPLFLQILELAGKYAGLCDWRPGSPQAPGSMGQFNTIVEWLD